MTPLEMLITIMAALLALTAGIALAWVLAEFCASGDWL